MKFAEWDFVARRKWRRFRGSAAAVEGEKEFVA